MSAAAQIVRPGGSIIAAAECLDGIPDHGEYGRLLRSSSGPREILETVHTPGHNVHDQWQVQIQAQIQLKADVKLKSTYLTDEQVRGAHIQPVQDIAQTVEEELRRHGSDSRLCVIPEGPRPSRTWRSDALRF